MEKNSTSVVPQPAQQSPMFGGQRVAFPAKWKEAFPMVSAHECESMPGRIFTHTRAHHIGSLEPRCQSVVWNLVPRCTSRAVVLDIGLPLHQHRGQAQQARQSGCPGFQGAGRGGPAVLEGQQQQQRLFEQRAGRQSALASRCASHGGDELGQHLRACCIRLLSVPNQSTNRLTNPSIHESINSSIHQLSNPTPINPFIHESLNQSTNHSVSQSVNQSINRPVERTNNQAN